MKRSPSQRGLRRLPLAAAALALLAPAFAAEPVPVVEVVGHYDNAVGSSDAASAGSVTQRLIANRPALRPGEILEFVPGMIVTQHSGDGKANQYFLRGFNLDHGTDFATSVDGMPVNMGSHAHGQGYSDLNFLIPELVRRIDYRKGPYFAQDGDFATAGSARIGLVDTLAPVASLTLGGHGFRRALLGGSTALGESGFTLLGALELQRNDGPWQVPEDHRKLNGLLRASRRDGRSDSSLTLMGYDARWTATDQVPQRAVDAGTLDRFGSLDPSDGGQGNRYSLSAQHRQRLEDGEWRASAYAIASRLNLWSNFSYATDPVDGDQFEQAERRRVVGGSLSRRWSWDSAGGTAHDLEAGLQLRHDRLSGLGLYRTAARQRLATTSEADVRQTVAGVYTQWNAQWLPWLRTLAGLRADRADFRVAARGGTATSGSVQDHKVSPKLGAVFGPWNKTELFVNAGRGFHSNDARGTTAAVDPVPALVAGRGSELGLRTEALLPGLQSSLALWQLDLDSELVYIGDEGATEAQAASRRRGVELNNHWVLDAVGLRGWLLDLDLAWSRARFRGAAAGADGVPNAVNRVLSAGLAYAPAGGRWFGQFQVRHFGPRDLTEDGSVRSRPTTLAYLRAGWRATPRLTLTADVFNLFDRKANDIEYFYESRLPGEAAPVADRHFHPVEPRTLRLTAALSF